MRVAGNKDGFAPINRITTSSLWRPERINIYKITSGCRHCNRERGGVFSEGRGGAGRNAS
jgi:hypothetical protein